MPELEQKHQVLLLFDSWYAKSVVVCLADEYENLDIICNTRYDSAIYDLPPAPTVLWSSFFVTFVAKKFIGLLLG
ncbi:MAG: hypothetical protein ACI4F9_10385 [Lachnospiraceae bacterium]